MNTKTVIVLIGAAAVIAVIFHVITPNQKDTSPTLKIAPNSSNTVDKDSKEAEALIAKMHEKIDTVANFQNHQDLDISGNIYHFVTGMGQSHYFYYRGNDAIWIGMASPEEIKILSEVIHML